jgi:adenylate cyclase
MILLTFRHGLRAAEVCDLRWEQVDFKAATLHVRRLKNGTPRSLLIGLRASGRIRLGAKCVNMAKEIERKFLVKGDAWRALAKGTTYRQGYLNSAKERTVRIRTADAQAFITIKGMTVGATRSEYEYEIPFDEGKAMLDTLTEKPLIEKTRYKIPVGNLTWEIDEFLGENAGLIVAEVELKSEDQTFDKPVWVGDEVTNDSRYFNANLVKEPFTRW